MSSLSRRPVYLILFATLAAAGGNGISLIAFPWLVLQRNGSASEASIVAGAASLPLVFSTMIAGTAVDSLGRQSISIASDVLSGTTVATVPVLAITLGQHSISVGVLAVLAALGAVFDPAGITARESMLPEAAAQAGWTLDRTNGIYEAIFNVAYIVGPGAGGALIATIGGINTMWVTAGAFGLAIAAVSTLRFAGAGPPPVGARPASPWSGMADGLRFVWNLKVLRTLALIDLVMTGLYLPIESVLFPKYFADHHQPAHLGWVLMALSIGGLAGALAYPMGGPALDQTGDATGRHPDIGRVHCADLVVASVVGDLGAVRAGRTGLRADRTDLQLRDADQVATTAAGPRRRRDELGGVAVGPLGFTLAGPLTDAAGLRTTFLALAIPMIVIGLVSLGLPSLRELDYSPASPV